MVSGQTDSQKQFKLVFILSAGRSGSTLLDLLLGAQNGIWTLGEIHYLQESISQGRRCGCGRTYDECNFWQEVMRNVDIYKGDYPINYFQLPQSRGAFSRLKWILSVLIGHQLPGMRSAITSYGSNNYQFLGAVEAAVRNQTGENSDWFVDATKHGHRLFWLSQNPFFDFRVVHLTKDPRAFVYSLVRKDKGIKLSQIIYFSFYWLGRNLFFLRMRALAGLKKKSKLVHYEDLASKPQTTLNELGMFLGMDFDMALAQNIRVVENHAVGGNRVRLDWEVTEIRLDEKWKKMLPKSYSRLIWFLCWPLAKFFKYSFQ